VIDLIVIDVLRATAKGISNAMMVWGWAVVDNSYGQLLRYMSSQCDLHCVHLKCLLFA
jgi:hypothetical protein